MSLLPSSSTLFPYTTLFRSGHWLRNQPALRASKVLRTVCPWSEVLTREPAIYLNRGIFDKDQSPGASDRKSTRLNSSHTVISYAVFCLKKKKNQPEALRPCT